MGIPDYQSFFCQNSAFSGLRMKNTMLQKTNTVEMRAF